MNKAASSATKSLQQVLQELEPSFRAPLVHPNSKEYVPRPAGGVYRPHEGLNARQNVRRSAATQTA